ncbi:LysR family transcriptional regulator [Comamonadaceae bacterium OH2545_COT-014]|nr:LysR family transcriptional regulator [Comamonadaceae bacterium OH2545_COT-014]
MTEPSHTLTPETLAMLATIAEAGSFAAAARRLNLVPSALTYRVRQLEDTLDVLLFDRSARQARPTPAGAELLRESARLLADVDAVARRVRRVATGWEPQLTVIADGIICTGPMLELVEAFYAQRPAPPTRIKLLDGVLSGTLEALTTGRADLALGVAAPLDSQAVPGLQSRELGEMSFIFAVAPHHPLAQAPEPLTDAALHPHRIIAVADSAQRGSLSYGLLPGQDVLTVPTLHTKLQAQLRGLGYGFLPEPLARPHLEAGQLVTRRVARPARTLRTYAVWGGPQQAAHTHPAATPGRALAWWVAQLDSAATRAALLGLAPAATPPSQAPARPALRT